MPHDLFHQIGRARHVAAPGRRGDLHRVAAFDLEAQTGKDAGDLRPGHFEAAQLLHHGGIESDGLAQVRRRAGHHDVRRLAAAKVEDHPGREFEPRQHEVRIDATFEAIARVRHDAERPPCARNGHRIEPGRFDEHVGRRFRAGRRFAAHHARDAECGFIVGDDDHAGIERVGFAVQRQHLLSSASTCSPSLAKRARRLPFSFAASNTCSGRPRSCERKLVTSTSAEMGRRPTAFRKSCSHLGDGPVFDAADQPARKDGCCFLLAGREIERGLDRRHEFSGNR